MERSVIRSQRNDIKICRQSKCHFQNLIVVTLPTQNSVFDDFLLCPPNAPSLKSTNSISIVVSPSLSYGEFWPDSAQKPKGPFRTKNATALNSVVFCYGRSFLLFLKRFAADFPLKNSGFKVSAVVFYYRRSELTPRSEFTIRSIFSTGGSFGKLLCRGRPE